MQGKAAGLVETLACAGGRARIVAYAATVGPAGATPALEDAAGSHDPVRPPVVAAFAEAVAAASVSCPAEPAHATTG